MINILAILSIHITTLPSYKLIDLDQEYCDAHPTGCRPVNLVDFNENGVGLSSYEIVEIDGTSTKLNFYFGSQYEGAMMYGHANAINDLRVVTGTMGIHKDNGGLLEAPSIWIRSAFRLLRSFEPGIGFRINNNGNILVRFANGTPEGKFSYYDGDFKDLATVENLGVPFANDLNNFEVIVGSVGHFEKSRSYSGLAAKWVDLKIQLLDEPDSMNGWSSSARAINSAGRIVGYKELRTSETFQRIARAWPENGFPGLDLQTPAGCNSIANDINDNGITVGQISCGPGDSVAVLWDVGGQMYKLNDLVPARYRSLVSAKWVKNSNFIAGTMKNKDANGNSVGNLKNFILFPQP